MKLDFKNFSQILNYWAVETPEKIFVTDILSGKSCSYADFNKLVNSTARFLKKHRVGRGDIVSLCLRNSLEFLVAYFATIRLGAIINPIPISVADKELAANLDFSKPKLSLLEVPSTKIAKRHKIFSVKFQGKGAFLKILKNFSNKKLPISLDENKPVCLYYSSGTTAKPKGIIFSHRGIINIISATCRWFGHNSNSRHLAILPMAHTSVMHYSVLPVLYVGGSFVFAKNFIKIRKDFWRIIRDYKVNYVQTVPTIILMILSITYSNYHRSRLILPYIACGSAPLPEKNKKLFENRFGLRLANLYGLSEAGHLASDYPFEKGQKPGSIGRPLDIVDLKVFDNQGREVPVGKTGEIAVKTPGFFLGYHKDKKLYESSFKNGYFCTGDLAWKDNSSILYYVGRKRDLIIKGGVNISPNLIDEVLVKHPAVAEAASVGKPDELFGEVAKSFVVLKFGRLVSQKELFDYCRRELGEFKSPSEIEFIKEIPKTASGKILRRKLK